MEEMKTMTRDELAEMFARAELMAAGGCMHDHGPDDHVHDIKATGVFAGRGLETKPVKKKKPHPGWTKTSEDPVLVDKEAKKRADLLFKKKKKQRALAKKQRKRR